MRALKRCGPPGRRDRGLAIVEFALMALVFFMLVFAVVDLGAMFWANLTMQHAVREGARYAVTGLTDLDTDPSPDRYDAVVQAMRKNAMGLYDRLAPEISVSTVDAAGNLVPAQHSFGGAGDIIVIHADCKWPLMTPLMQPFFPNGEYVFRVGATMKNEAFK